MKALRSCAPEGVLLAEVPEPRSGPAEVELRIGNCSTSGTAVGIDDDPQNLNPPRIIGDSEEP